MNNKEIAQKLVEFCREGKNDMALETLYADNIVSVEAADGPDMPDAPKMPRVMEGISAVKEKNDWWINNHEVHNAEALGPFPHGDDKFATMFKYDVTFKPTGQRNKMEEVAIYTTNNGKIVREEFYYNMG